MIIRRRKKKSYWLEYLAAFQIMASSGGFDVIAREIFGKRVHNLLYAFYFMTGFVLFCKRGKKVFNSSAQTALLMSLWLAFARVIIDMYSGEGVQLDSLFGAPFVMIGSYLIISSVDFYKFREILLRTLNLISIATIVGWVIHENFFPNVYSYRGISFRSIYFFVFHKWTGRMASLWWEPGMYQIIMIFVLMLFMDQFKKITLSNIHYYIKRFGWIIACLIMCRSTMGYICFIAIIGLIILFNDTLGKKKLLYFLGLILGVALIAIIYNSDVVQKKIGDQYSRSSSYIDRMGGNITGFQTSLVYPIVGAGQHPTVGTRSTNGWLNLAIRAGWPFLICFVLIFLKNLQRMKPGIPTLMAFIPLFLSYANEGYILYPIAFIYIFKYKSYNKKFRSRIS